MWEKPVHRKIEGTARPLRVAYLVDLETCVCLGEAALQRELTWSTTARVVSDEEVLGLQGPV